MEDGVLTEECRNGTLRTEKDAMIQRLQEGVKLHQMSIEHSKSIIESYEEELKELLNKKPKLTAADFPCLDYCANRVTFNDGKNMYTITENFKQIIRSARATEDVIDENVEMVECMLSEIRVGDYFQYPLRDAKKSNSYFYCSAIDLYKTYPLMAMWVESELILMNSLCADTDTIVNKFVLRNK